MSLCQKEFGSYEIVELLSRGAMGEVYRAHDKMTSRDAALKMIRRDAECSWELQDRLFLQEAQLLARLRSKHTVTFYDFGTANNGRRFLAMELLKGLDLRELVRRFGPQPPTRVASILAQICDSLADLHQLGMVHNDISPDNVFLCRIAGDLDIAKVIDLGIAGASGEILPAGKPAFASPEQILGNPATDRTDLYGVGGVGYYLLTGQLPFPGDDPHVVKYGHVAGPIPRLPAEICVAAPQLAQLISNCLAKLPRLRPVSAEALADALREVACTECITLRDGAALL